MNNAYILVVEDESIVAKDIQIKLRNLGYFVPFTAATGEGAIEIALACCPDLCTMDVHLKGEMDGIEAAIQICSICHCPIVYLTAFNDSPTLERALATNPSGYVLKPFIRKKLASIIESALAA